ncbi:prepilin-type N-terminal cleavage/methylation domain-containing protein [Massilia sp. IC2-477]|uniref:PilW family protein n=1 Tax=Massilia sp. IC2-477 TaxID=2887198 RepID=UPI001D1039C4|nr:prepilin-type N-terminal cleavage/methylation domain-containing protein [Massilia sp. IC2-477]MCC2954872.1 prepilin-type N-terminal cleavage/methylation domain-containing protein [Massilia sp. IC2-477]
MTRRTRRRQDGITLVELLMALVICALVIGPLTSMLSTSMQAGMQNSSKAVLQQDLRFALARISSAATDTPRKALAPQNTVLSDSGGWFDKSRFRVNAGKQLIEVRDGVDNVLAESVAAFGVSARTVNASATIVEASLRLERDAQSAQGSIAVRMGGPRP